MILIYFNKKLYDVNTVKHFTADIFSASLNI